MLQEEFPLPALQEENRLALLPKDPNSALIYWELTPETLMRTRAMIRLSPQLRLRVHRFKIGEKRSRVLDLPLNEWVGRYKLELDEPGLQLVAALGFQSEEGFIHMIQTSTISLPRRQHGGGALRFAEALSAPSKESALKEEQVKPSGQKLSTEIEGPPPVIFRAGWDQQPQVQVPGQPQLSAINTSALLQFRMGALGYKGEMSDLQQLSSGQWLEEVIP